MREVCLHEHLWKIYAEPVTSTEVQNHREVVVARGLWRPSGLQAQLKQGHLEQGAQDHVQAALEDFQRGKLKGINLGRSENQRFPFSFINFANKYYRFSPASPHKYPCTKVAFFHRRYSGWQ